MSPSSAILLAIVLAFALGVTILHLLRRSTYSAWQRRNAIFHMLVAYGIALLFALGLLDIWGWVFTSVQVMLILVCIAWLCVSGLSINGVSDPHAPISVSFQGCSR